MTIRNQNAKINRGDSVTLFVALTQADGTPFDPTLEAVIKWRLLRNAYDMESSALVRKDLGAGITIVTAPIKGVNISLSALDTNIFPRYYFHELKVFDGGDVTTAMSGLIILKRAVQMVKELGVEPASRTIMLSGQVPTRTP